MKATWHTLREHGVTWLDFLGLRYRRKESTPSDVNPIKQMERYLISLPYQTKLGLYLNILMNRKDSSALSEQIVMP